MSCHTGDTCGISGHVLKEICKTCVDAKLVLSVVTGEDTPVPGVMKTFVIGLQTAKTIRLVVQIYKLSCLWAIQKEPSNLCKNLGGKEGGRCLPVGDVLSLSLQY